MVSPAKSSRCRRTDHPVCADSVASQRFYCWRSHPSSVRVLQNQGQIKDQSRPREVENAGDELRKIRQL